MTTHKTNGFLWASETMDNGSSGLQRPSSSSVTGAIGSPARVLVVRNGRSDVSALRWGVRALDLESSWARSGLEGIAALRQTQFDVVLVDEQLPDMSGADLVRTLHAEYDSSRFVIVRNVTNGFSTAPNIDTLPVLEEPYRCINVITMIDAVLCLNGVKGDSPHSAHTPPDAHSSRAMPIARMAGGSVAERWASFVLRAIDAVTDPKTVTMWARAVGVSRSVLSECCRLVHVSAHDARDFARFLRAICHAGDRWEPEALLDLADARTLRKLEAKAGLLAHVESTPTVRQFVEQQQWIPKANPGLIALCSLLFDIAPNAGK